MNKFFERRESPIHGIGSFAIVDIPRGTELCIGHYCDGYNNYYRTRQIGFFNHSEKPNAITPYKHIRYKNGLGMITVVKTLVDIKKGEEILFRYRWYDPTKLNTEDNKHYIPLPDSVYLRDDKLYASKDIKKSNDFGISHNFVKYLNQYVANPLGGFLTKDNFANCLLMEKEEKKHLLSTKLIKKDTLLTINYHE